MESAAGESSQEVTDHESVRKRCEHRYPIFDPSPLIRVGRCGRFAGYYINDGVGVWLCGKHVGY